MNRRKEFVCVFANGRISHGPSGVTFKGDNVKVIKVNPNISLDKLKQAIGQKLQLPASQIVSNLIYRYPTSINPPQFQAYNLEDDSDISHMWDMTKTLSTQLTCAELCANICDLSEGGHIGLHAVTNCDLSDGGHVGPSCSFNPEDIHLSVEHLLNRPSCSVNPDNIHLSVEPPLDVPSYFVHETEDIMDDSEDEDEYDSYLDGIDNDNDDHNNVHGEQHEENELATAFLSQIPNDSMITHEFDEVQELMNVTDEEGLYVGKTFSSVRVLRRVVKLYSVRVHHTFRVFHSSKKYEEYRCINYGENCNWRLRACKKESRNFWEITKYVGPHTCLSTSLTQDHPKLDSDVISSCIVGMVTDKPDVKVSQIIERMQAMFGYTISYKKAWKAKQLAVAIAFGNWERSYVRGF